MGIFTQRWLMDESMEKLTGIFKPKIKHVFLYLHPNISCYFINSTYLYKFNMLCSYNLRSNVGRTDKFPARNILNYLKAMKNSVNEIIDDIIFDLRLQRASH